MEKTGLERILENIGLTHVRQLMGKTVNVSFTSKAHESPLTVCFAISSLTWTSTELKFPSVVFIDSLQEEHLLKVGIHAIDGFYIDVLMYGEWHERSFAEKTYNDKYMIRDVVVDIF